MARACPFHGVTALAMTTTLSSASIWFVWSGQGNQAAARFFAAAVPAAYWAPFFLAPLVPGTAVDDPPHPVQQVASVPMNLLSAGATSRQLPLAGSSTVVPCPRPRRDDRSGTTTYR